MFDYCVYSMCECEFVCCVSNCLIGAPQTWPGWIRSVQGAKYTFEAAHPAISHAAPVFVENLINFVQSCKVNRGLRVLCNYMGQGMFKEGVPYRDRRDRVSVLMPRARVQFVRGLYSSQFLRKLLRDILSR